MNHTAAYRWIPRGVLACMTLLTWCGVAAIAQNTSQATNVTTPFRVRATHILGFADAPTNTNGTLSLQDNALKFQRSGKAAVEVKIASVEAVILGELSKQVGGLPMTLGKAASPYGGGRVVSLFAHKKYDTLTVQYVDAEGGIHGAIFQLNKGQGELVRNELVAKGAGVRQREVDVTSQSTPEVSRENK